MRCPFCRHEDTKVIDSRTMDDNTAIRRRRACEKCGERFTTFERIDTAGLILIKRNGEREPFERAKLLGGIMKSCNKRPVSVERMEAIAENIEASLRNSMSKEVESKAVGDMVMEALKKVDEVAYVRFASVYKQFKDVDSFMAELRELIGDKKE